MSHRSYISPIDSRGRRSWAGTGAGAGWCSRCRSAATGCMGRRSAPEAQLSAQLLVFGPSPARLQVEGRRSAGGSGPRPCWSARQNASAIMPSRSGTTAGTGCGAPRASRPPTAASPCPIALLHPITERSVTTAGRRWTESQYRRRPGPWDSCFPRGRRTDQHEHRWLAARSPSSGARRSRPAAIVSCVTRSDGSSRRWRGTPPRLVRRPIVLHHLRYRLGVRWTTWRLECRWLPVC